MIRKIAIETKTKKDLDDLLDSLTEYGFAIKKDADGHESDYHAIISKEGPAAYIMDSINPTILKFDDVNSYGVTAMILCTSKFNNIEEHCMIKDLRTKLDALFDILMNSQFYSDKFEVLYDRFDAYVDQYMNQIAFGFGAPGEDLKIWKSPLDKKYKFSYYGETPVEEYFITLEIIIKSFLDIVWVMELYELGGENKWIR